MSSSSRIRVSSVLVSCVTATSSGRDPSGRVSPSTAASIMRFVPKACTFTMSAPSSRRTRIERPTVFGMSHSLRSRNTLCPRSLTARTMFGPAA